MECVFSIRVCPSLESAIAYAEDVAQPSREILHRNHLKHFRPSFGIWDKYSIWNPRNSTYFGRMTMSS